MTLLVAPIASLHVSSVLLGPLTIDQDTIITFPAGIPGFHTLRQFALVETQRDDLVWLQSIDEPALSFLLADPFVIVPQFAVDIPPADLAALGATTSAARVLLVLAVVQLEAGVPVALNLQSPIVIDRERRLGRQVILPDSTYGMHHAITLD